jgi:hypothetical protein
MLVSAMFLHLKDLARLLARTTAAVTVLATVLPAQYNFVPFDLPGSGVISTSPAAINNNGDIAGTYEDGSFATHGFVRTAGGLITTFDLPATGTIVTGINDLGEVGGYLHNQYSDQTSVTNVYQGFVRDAQGRFTFFSGQNGAGTASFGLNNLGESITTASPAPGSGPFFLRMSNDTYIPIPPMPLPAGVSAQTLLNLTLNNSGQAAGTAMRRFFGSNLTSTQGFLLDLSSGAYTLLASGTVNGLNDSAATVGVVTPTATALGYNFLQNSVGATSLFYPPFYNATALGINQAGQITGSYGAPGLLSRGFTGLPAADRTPPAVSLTGIANGPPKQAVFSVVDPGSGIFVINTVQTNAEVVIGPYANSQETPATVTATKLNQAQTATIEIEASDLAGNVTIFDPVLTTVYGEAGPVPDVLTGVPPFENVVIMANGSPGLDRLDITVNGHVISVVLSAGEKRTINLGGRMTEASNSVAFAGEGAEGTEAFVILQQGDMPPDRRRFMPHLPR